MSANTNNVTLCGKIITSIEKTEIPTQDYGNLHLFTMAVTRLSGTVDEIKVMCPKALLSYGSISQGDYVQVNGSLNTDNWPFAPNKLFVYIRCIQITKLDAILSQNTVYIEGYICKISKVWKTPFGRYLASLTIANNHFNKRSNYIPAIAWSGLANLVQKYPIGTKVAINGRIQSRNYEKMDGNAVTQRTAYELSIQTIEEIKKDDQDSSDSSIEST